MARKRSADLPSRKQILDFIAASDQPAGKREIARAFGIRGDAKIALKRLLNDMADEGLIESGRGRAFNKAGGVPRVTVLKIVEADDSGHVFGQPEHWEADTPPPEAADHREGAARSARHRRPGARAHRGARRALRRASAEEARAKGRSWCSACSRQEGTRFWLTPVEKKERRELAVSDVADGEAGDLVLCEVSGRGAAGDRARRCRARRPVRAQELQPDRDPQVRASARVQRCRDRRGEAGREAAARRARGPDSPADRRHRSRRRARP